MQIKMNSLIKQLCNTRVALNKGRHENVIYTRETDKSKRHMNLVGEDDMVYNITPLKRYDTSNVIRTRHSLKTAQEYAIHSKDVVVVLFVNPKVLIDYKRIVAFKHVICTNLEEILKTTDFFRNNILNYNNGLFTKKFIYIPDVVHLKNDRFDYHSELVQSHYVITYIPENQDFYLSERYTTKLNTNIKHILTVLASYGTKTIIFCIDSIKGKTRDKCDIATIIDKSLEEYDGVFEKVIFAM